MSSYQGFLIANYATGYDKELQPWLLPDDAQFELFDGYIYRGVWYKREGYTQYANGQEGGVPYCESRMVYTVTVSANEVPDGMITVFTFPVAGTTKPLRRGGFRAIDRTALGVQSQIIQDDGVGGTLAGSDGTITTVLNYTTTLATPQSVTFTIAPPVGHTVKLSLDVHQGLPVMGVMNFYTAQQTKELIVADTKYVNRYNNTTNRLDDISPAATYNGTKFNFWSWTNYNTPLDDERLLFVNNVDPIQAYDGTSITPYPVYTVQGAPIVGAAGNFGTGNGTPGPYTFTAGANTGILPGTVTVNAPVSVQTITFDSSGNATGDGTGTINFLSGTVTVTFNANVAIGDDINISYTPLTTPIDTALHIFQMKDRLILLRPIISGKTYNKRIMISGTGIFGDTFTSGATGAGFIDIPDDSFIVSADFNRDDLLIFTSLATWIQKYTGNDVVPFTIDKLDGTRGSEAPFGTITYLNTTKTESTRGFIVCDGYTVERDDNKVPEYSYNNINQDNFELCFAGKVDTDRDHYLIHPSQDQDDSTAKSDIILVHNYEEGVYSQYRIPLSCMGNYIEAFTVTWNDLLKYNTWDEMAAVYGNWNEFTYSKGAPIAIGGGHEGQIFQLNVSETEDYDVRIYNITVVNSNTIEVTTDFQNYALNDYVVIDGVSGMVQVNDKQGFITQVVSPYVFRLNVMNTSDFDTYTSGGTAYKVIVFQSMTKKFNPFSEQDKKVRCGWMYFYVSTSGTDLTDNKSITNVIQDAPADLVTVVIPNHGYPNNTLVQINGIVGSVELNGNTYFITVVDADSFTLNGTAGVAITPYVSGGFAATPTLPKLLLNCIVNDNAQPTVLNGFNPDPYEVNLAEDITLTGQKKWYKLWINQIGRFVQFEVISRQAGAKIQIQAMMPGFAPVGRLI